MKLNHSKIVQLNPCVLDILGLRVVSVMIFNASFQTLSVSMLLRYSHHQIFVFIGKTFISIIRVSVCEFIHIKLISLHTNVIYVPWKKLQKDHITY